MANIKLGLASFKRARANELEVFLKNRFYENNPTNLVDQVGLIVRPSLVRRTNIGTGPIRAMYYMDGVFSGDLFAVSGDQLFRVHKTYGAVDTVTPITGAIDGDDAPEMVATDTYLFITDHDSFRYLDGTNNLNAIAVPGGGIVQSIDTIAGYIILTLAGSDTFYWIEPAETTIDVLNFATAERAPDGIQNVRVIGDQIWFFGTSTTEIWYPTGDALAPFQRVQGRLFDRGVWQGTAVAIKDSTILVGADGRVYDVTGAPNPISTPGIEERIRIAIRAQET